MTSPVTDPLVWRVAAVVGAIDAGAIVGRRWTVHWSQLVTIALEIGTLCLIGWAYRTRGQAVARLAYAVALFFTCAFVGLVTTYVATPLGGRLWDVQLKAMDAALGFDWPRAWQIVTAHHWLYVLSGTVYGILIVQSFVTMLVLSFRPEGTTAYFRASGLAFLVAVAGSVLMPAVGTVPDGPTATVVLALRDGSLRDLNLFTPAGVIAMPSCHAVGAVLVVIALWPVRWLRWPALVLNLVMLAATVPMGAHYLVDVLAGIVLAVGAAWCVRMPALRPAVRDNGDSAGRRSESRAGTIG